MKRAVVIFGLIALFAPTGAHASSVGIEVLSTTYSIDIALRDRVGDSTLTTTATGSSPVSQSVEWHLFDNVINASATADWLAVSVELSKNTSEFPFSSATADFDLMFSPVTDGLAPLSIDTRVQPEYGGGLVTLFDVTMQQEVLRFYWGTPYQCALCLPTIIQGGIQSTAESYSGPYSLPTALSAANTYVLHLTASALSLPPTSEGASVRLSGLEPVHVPDPSSSLLLLATGLAGIGVFRRAFTRKPF